RRCRARRCVPRIPIRRRAQPVEMGRYPDANLRSCHACSGRSRRKALSRTATIDTLPPWVTAEYPTSHALVRSFERRLRQTVAGAVVRDGCCIWWCCFKNKPGCVSWAGQKKAPLSRGLEDARMGVWEGEDPPGTFFSRAA